MTPDPIYTHIGAVIKARRKTLEMTQETLAGKLGISRGSLANIETGRQNVLVHQLYRIAAALELSPFDLLPLAQSGRSVSQSIELPIPGDLKALQREQVERFFGQVETTQTQKEESRVKAAKR